MSSLFSCLSARTSLSFRTVSLSTHAWNSLKADSTWSFVFIGEAHCFQLWSSVNVTNYCDPGCDFLSTWHTSVCTSSNNAFRLIGGLVWKEVRFILSGNPFSSRVFGTVYSSRIPIDRQYSSNCPRYSPPLSAKTAFSFRLVSLSTLTWNSLKTDSTWSFIFISEAHSFRLWLSINVTKYCDPACDFLSTWHTLVCTNNAFRLIGGLVQKEVRLMLSVSPFSSRVFGTVYLSRIPFNRQYSSKCPR